MLVTAIVLAFIAVLVDQFLGPIKEPWRKFIVIGIVILFIVGVLQLLGLFPFVMRV
jgi:hypothetical protein